MQNAHMRVDGAAPRGLWPPAGGGLCKRVVKEKVLRIDRPAAGGFLSLTGPLAPRVADCPLGNEYKVSVTGLVFYVIWHDRHSADWLAALASPYPASPDCPRKRGQNKAPLCCELLMKGLLFRALFCPLLAVAE